MLRFLLFAFVFLIASPLVAAPNLKPEKPKHASVAGTTWVGKTAEGWAMTLEFLPDGVMRVSYNGMPHMRASWKQDGEKLYYEMNSKYAEFNGTIKDKLIEGDNHNVAGRNWTTQLTPAAK